MPIDTNILQQFSSYDPYKNAALSLQNSALAAQQAQSMQEMKMKKELLPLQKKAMESAERKSSLEEKISNFEYKQVMQKNYALKNIMPFMETGDLETASKMINSAPQDMLDNDDKNVFNKTIEAMKAGNTKPYETVRQFMFGIKPTGPTKLGKDEILINESGKIIASNDTSGILSADKQADLWIKQQELNIRQLDKDLSKQNTKFGQEKDLRSEVDKQSVNFNLSKDAYNRISAIKNGPQTAASDMALVFSYMKMLDPGSTVREGEYATAKNTTGIPDRILNSYNKAIDGQFLSDNQRSEFFNTSTNIFNKVLKTHNDSMRNYKKLAEKYELDPDKVVITDINNSFEKQTNNSNKNVQIKNKYNFDDKNLTLKIDGDNNVHRFPDMNSFNQYKAALKAVGQLP